MLTAPSRQCQRNHAGSWLCQHCLSSLEKRVCILSFFPNNSYFPLFCIKIHLRFFYIYYSLSQSFCLHVCLFVSVSVYVSCLFICLPIYLSMYGSFEMSWYYNLHALITFKNSSHLYIFLNQAKTMILMAIDILFKENKCKDDIWKCQFF